ncbi:hypothetical protein [Paraburkholderia domus]|uniref:Uncharacterized protein n=1 Tax=Paraburkholderia domus TaxID=2793075 RepID=A0A9N8N9M6_9BURK|nr:hypothetical protein R70211_07544 [Paraburkholderia domus]
MGTFRATGITAYLKYGGTLERAAAMANHASTRTTQLYDRRRDEISLDEVERIRVSRQLTFLGRSISKEEYPSYGRFKSGSDKIDCGLFSGT